MRENKFSPAASDIHCANFDFDRGALSHLIRWPQRRLTDTDQKVNFELHFFQISCFASLGFQIELFSFRRAEIIPFKSVKICRAGILRSTENPIYFTQSIRQTALEPSTEG